MFSQFEWIHIWEYVYWMWWQRQSGVYTNINFVLSSLTYVLDTHGKGETVNVFNKTKIQIKYYEQEDELIF